MATLPPSSPRLPSPPPPAEIQIGPKSPSMGSMSNRQAQEMEQTAINANSKRRIHPGTKASEMAAGPPLIPLSELDSAFQLQEHLAALHYHHTAANTNPINRETAKILATPPPGTDRTLWLYELCRFLVEQCNSLIIGFLFDTPPCSAATCPEMRASEWQFLCAVHDQPKSCCAIDYCCHTLDWAANVVTNPQIFPSRFVLSDGHDKGAAVKNLVNVFRRLHRIFAHAWFQHRGVFWTVEGQTGLYVLFKTVCDLYDLLPGENYKLPPEAEGLETPMASHAVALEQQQIHHHQQAGPYHHHQHQHQRQQPHHSAQAIPTSIARPPRSGGNNNNQAIAGTGANPTDGEDEHLNPSNSRTNTRRHIRSSPSTGSAVTTVIEADEDETSATAAAAAEVTSRLRELQIMDPAAAEDDLDAAEVPVLVEQGIPIEIRGGADDDAEPPLLATQSSSQPPPIRISTQEIPVSVPGGSSVREQQEQQQVRKKASGSPGASEADQPAADSTMAEAKSLESPEVETPVVQPLASKAKEDGEDATAGETVPAESTSGETEGDGVDTEGTITTPATDDTEEPDQKEVTATAAGAGSRPTSSSTSITDFAETTAIAPEEALTGAPSKGEEKSEEGGPGVGTTADAAEGSGDADTVEEKK